MKGNAVLELLLRTVCNSVIVVVQKKGHNNNKHSINKKFNETQGEKEKSCNSGGILL